MLATVGNSFFARVFGIEKKGVVKARMSGVAGEDLWVACYAAPLTGASPEALMAARQGSSSWASAIADRQGVPKGLEGRFVKAVRDGRPDGELAALAVGDVLSLRLGTGGDELAAMSSSGATLAEIVTAAVISRWDGRSPSSLLYAVRDGRTTWDSLLHRRGIAPEEAEERIGELLDGPPPGQGEEP